MAKENGQIDLFHGKSFKTKQQIQHDKAEKQAKWNALSPDEKVYIKLQEAHLTKKLHIRSGAWCRSTLMWFITNGNLMDNVANQLCKELKKLNPYYYYHYRPSHNPQHIKFYRYDAFAMLKVLEAKPSHDTSLDKPKKAKHNVSSDTKPSNVNNQNDNDNQDKNSERK